MIKKPLRMISRYHEYDFSLGDYVIKYRWIVFDHDGVRFEPWGNGTCHAISKEKSCTKSE